MEKTHLIRAVYLYAASIIGLMFVVSSAIIFINLALKATVFTQADMDYYPSPAQMITVDEASLQAVAVNPAITLEQKNAIEGVLNQVKNEDLAPKKDILASQRQREASNAIAMLVVGLALYLYHWRIIQRENDKLKK